MATETKTDTVESPDVQPGRGASTRFDRPAIIQAWQINRRLLTWTLMVGALLLPVVYFWYKFQVQRHAQAVYDLARAQYDKEDWNGAAGAFHRYLQLRPEDGQALLLRAQAFDKLAVEPDQLPRAASFYFQAVQANPDRHDIRLRLA